jgi:hypothetical protein
MALDSVVIVIEPNHLAYIELPRPKFSALAIWPIPPRD